MNSARTPQEIINFMREGAIFRDFGYMINQMCPGVDAAKILSAGLCEITGESYASVSRKVRNWFNGKNLPRSRETIFQICFILKLNEAQSNVLTGRLSDTGIHYRNPEELAYAFALRTGRSYADALELKEKALQLCAGAMEIQGAPRPDIYTRQVKRAFDDVYTEGAFEQFFIEHGAELGSLHNTAYKKFVELLDVLQSPETYARSPERSYTLAEVMREYMQLHVPVQQRRGAKAKNAVKMGDLDVYQKLIKKYWPSESTLIRMRSRSEDVDRKTLLLLYLATEAFDDENEEDFDLYEDCEDDPDLLLEIRIEKMRLFLDEYGMNPLDPGNPFDFLVIYSMRTEEDEEARIRMEKVLELLFSDDME